jgi:DNA-binding MarR family transcriptional regulator
MYTYDLSRHASAAPRWKGRAMKSNASKLASAKDDDAPAGYMLEHQVGHLLRRAHQRHTTIFQDGMGETQLTPTQYAALVKIRDQGQISQNQLGRLTAMDPATIQGVVQRLAARGLVDRTPDSADRRLMQLRLTAKGRALVQSAIARGIAISEATLTPLSEAERPLFLSLLRKLI